MKKGIITAAGTELVEMTEEEIAAKEAMEVQSYAQLKSTPMTDTEKLALLAATLTEDTTDKRDNGQLKTEPVIENGTIKWLPTAERAGDGTLTNPKQYFQGDEVEAGIYYCIYKISPAGRHVAQLTQGTYKAITTGTPSKFGAITHFEFVH